MGSEKRQKDPIFEEKHAEQRQVLRRAWKMPVLRELNVKDVRTGDMLNADFVNTQS